MTTKFRIIAIVILGGLILNSCLKKDDSTTIIQVNDGSSLAYLKFINVYTAASPSAASPAAGPTVNIFVNDAKINATPISYGGSFPLSPSYTGVTPALASNIKVILNRATGAVAGDTLINKTYDLSPNSYTTIYLTDTTPSVTPLSPYFLPFAETVSEAKVGFFKARFVNMIPSLDTLEVFSKRLNAVMFAGTKYKFATDMVELPTYILNDTLQLRKVSAPSVNLLSTPVVFSPTSNRVYTFYCTGNITGTPKPRALTSFINR